MASEMHAEWLCHFQVSTFVSQCTVHQDHQDPPSHLTTAGMYPMVEGPREAILGRPPPIHHVGIVGKWQPLCEATMTWEYLLLQQDSGHTNY